MLTNLIMTSLLQMRFRVEDHVFKNNIITKSKAAVYLNKINKLVSKTEKDKRILQVAETLKSQMKNLINEDQFSDGSSSDDNNRQLGNSTLAIRPEEKVVRNKDEIMQMNYDKRDSGEAIASLDDNLNRDEIKIKDREVVKDEANDNNLVVLTKSLSINDIEAEAEVITIDTDSDNDSQSILTNYNINNNDKPIDSTQKPICDPNLSKIIPKLTKAKKQSCVVCYPDYKSKKLVVNRSIAVSNQCNSKEDKNVLLKTSLVPLETSKETRNTSRSMKFGNITKDTLKRNANIRQSTIAAPNINTNKAESQLPTDLSKIVNEKTETKNKASNFKRKYTRVVRKRNQLSWLAKIKHVREANEEEYCTNYTLPTTFWTDSSLLPDITEKDFDL